MAVSTEDRMRLFENVVARVGMSGDVFGEYSKALSTLNGMQSYRDANPPVIQSNLPPEQQNASMASEPPLANQTTASPDNTGQLA